MSDELKPCPFCGGKVDPTGWLTGYGETGPECEECGATAPTLEIWNNSRMAELEAKLGEAVELLKVSNALLECNAQPIDKPSIEANTAFLARHGDRS